MLLGHDGPPSSGLWTENLLTNEPLDRCPLRTLQLAPESTLAEVTRYVDELYPAYQDGFLLVGAGIAEQPARYVEAMRLIGSLERRADAKQAEIERQNATTGS